MFCSCRAHFARAPLDLHHQGHPPLSRLGWGRIDPPRQCFALEPTSEVHYLPRQVFDQLLADDAILLARQFCDRDRVDHFICFIGIDFV